jgi:hypothetical protein
VVFSTNKTDCHDITEILLKVALNTIKQTNTFPTLILKLYCFIWVISLVKGNMVSSLARGMEKHNKLEYNFIA